MCAVLARVQSQALKWGHFSAPEHKQITNSITCCHDGSAIRLRMGAIEALKLVTEVTPVKQGRF